ncbi:phage tail tape measure protein, TP901 family, core region [Methylomagnum ishizawai]|uniref:Phage tail tape measure protein, TP901 family, core region n=1 Tax=Methylomagnum ishizawai TaxID=1760988 RepID=A0A1Y6D214_9GAMM|nr:phage tail tape measure protein [Methylomagnum ishizawai]SMF94434.1 phage tail tape measure protein, TP901 family, core region [Methylomagnum ishizawai]
MAAATSRLEFVLSLIDRMTGPAGKAMKALDKLTGHAEKGYQRIGYGVAGLVGTGAALVEIVNPARKMNKALGEVKSLGVAQDVLDSLNITALKFSTQYGTSAAEFVSASYDIQGAIAGLVGNELPAFTTASALLAKGTKADVGDITSYVGTMYGIFQKTADQMGRSNWVEMLAAQTAMAVNVFKTDGKGMSEAFTNLGANATTAGIAMAEQFAVLGTLQATMPGAEAGTKYRAFLDGVGGAQKELGLKFTDARGRLLPMVDVLNKIKGKYGEIDTVAESGALKKAFGSGDAVSLIKLLMTDVDGLGKNIKDIGQQKGLAELQRMADAMVDPFDRVISGANALRIAVGQKMVSALTPTLDKITALEQRLLRWTYLFPHLTAALGKGVLGILALIAAVSALSIAVGVGRFLLVGLQGGMMLLQGAVWLLIAPFKLLRLAWLAALAVGGLWRGMLAGLRALMLAFALQTSLSAAGMWLWGAASKGAAIAAGLWRGMLVGLRALMLAFALQTSLSAAGMWLWGAASKGAAIAAGMWRGMLVGLRALMLAFALQTSLSAAGMWLWGAASKGAAIAAGLWRGMLVGLRALMLAFALQTSLSAAGMWLWGAASKGAAIAAGLWRGMLAGLRALMLAFALQTSLSAARMWLWGAASKGAAIAAGLWRGMLVGLRALMLAFALQTSLSAAGMLAWQAAARLAGAVGAVWQGSMAVVSGALALLRGALFASLPAVWGFAAALLANPITWVVAGVIALGAAVVAAVVYWDEWTGAVGRWTGSILGAVQTWLASIGSFGVGDIVAGWDSLTLWWDGFTAGMGGYVASILGAWSGLTGWWDGFIGGISAQWQALVGAIASLNPFAGWSMPSFTMPSFGAAPAAALPPPPAGLAAPKGGGAPGGVAKQISTAINTNSSRSIGAVHVHNYGQPMSGQRLAHELNMAAP